MRANKAVIQACALWLCMTASAGAAGGKPPAPPPAHPPSESKQTRARLLKELEADYKARIQAVLDDLKAKERELKESSWSAKDKREKLAALKKEAKEKVRALEEEFRQKKKELLKG